MSAKNPRGVGRKQFIQMRGIPAQTGPPAPPKAAATGDHRAPAMFDVVFGADRHAHECLAGAVRPT
jgi:hypothetical protein